MMSFNRAPCLRPGQLSSARGGRPGRAMRRTHAVTGPLARSSGSQLLQAVLMRRSCSYGPVAGSCSPWDAAIAARKLRCGVSAVLRWRWLLAAPGIQTGSISHNRYRIGAPNLLV
jgi:hypothetical protein